MAQNQALLENLERMRKESEGKTGIVTTVPKAGGGQYVIAGGKIYDSYDDYRSQRNQAVTSALTSAGMDPATAQSKAATAVDLLNRGASVDDVVKRMQSSQQARERADLREQYMAQGYSQAEAAELARSQLPSQLDARDLAMRAAAQALSRTLQPGQSVSVSSLTDPFFNTPEGREILERFGLGGYQPQYVPGIGPGRQPQPPQQAAQPIRLAAANAALASIPGTAAAQPVIPGLAQTTSAPRNFVDLTQPAPTGQLQPPMPTITSEMLDPDWWRRNFSGVTYNGVPAVTPLPPVDPFPPASVSDEDLLNRRPGESLEQFQRRQIETLFPGAPFTPPPTTSSPPTHTLPVETAAAPSPYPGNTVPLDTTPTTATTGAAVQAPPQPSQEAAALAFQMRSAEELWRIVEQALAAEYDPQERALLDAARRARLLLEQEAERLRAGTTEEQRALERQLANILEQNRALWGGRGLGAEAGSGFLAGANALSQAATVEERGRLATRLAMALEQLAQRGEQTQQELSGQLAALARARGQAATGMFDRLMSQERDFALRAAQQALAERQFERGVFESDRAFGRSVLESDRAFAEDVRRYGLEHALREADQRYRLERGYGLLPFEMEQARQAVESGRLGLEQQQAEFAEWQQQAPMRARLAELEMERAERQATIEQLQAQIAQSNDVGLLRQAEMAMAREQKAIELLEEQIQNERRRTTSAAPTTGQQQTAAFNELYNWVVREKDRGKSERQIRDEIQKGASNLGYNITVPEALAVVDMVFGRSTPNAAGELNQAAAKLAEMRRAGGTYEQALDWISRNAGSWQYASVADLLKIVDQLWPWE